MTNNIFARTSSQNRNQANSVKSRPAETAETAGSLAMNSQKSYLAMNSYDLFTPSSPYSLNIDFSNYANVNNSGNHSMSSSNGGFWNSFANAIAVVGTDCTGGFAGGGASVSSGASCGGGGGFTSFV